MNLQHRGEQGYGHETAMRKYFPNSLSPIKLFVLMESRRTRVARPREVFPDGIQELVWSRGDTWAPIRVNF